MKIRILLKYFILTFLNLKLIQRITTVKQILQFSLHALYLLALVFTRSSYVIDNVLLDLQILL